MRQISVVAGAIFCLFQVNGIGTTYPAAAMVTALQQPAPSPVPGDSEVRALLDRYCVTCHNERLKTAGLLLDKLDLSRISQDAETWEKVARKVRTASMPPAGSRRPDQAGYETLT